MTEDAKEPSPEALKIWKAVERSPGMGWLPQAIDAAIDTAVQTERERWEKPLRKIAREAGMTRARDDIEALLSPEPPTPGTKHERI